MGGKGVAQNLSEAFYWLAMAADKGSADAQYRLGQMYEDGLGVEQNMLKAQSWYRQAASRGEARARNKLDELRKKTGLLNTMFRGS